MRNAIFGFVLLTLAGCGGTGPDGYDPGLRFPFRSDPLVLSTPPEAPPRGPEPGRLTDWFAGLPSRGGKTFDPNTLDAATRGRIAAVLDDRFGTPAAPHLPDPTAAALGLTDSVLAEGSKLYRRQCAHCHGLAGEGRGPTGDWIAPRPRDLRQGVFKFGSNPTGTMTRVDLTNQIRHGVPGTAMQPFGLLSDAELDLLAAAAMHLAIRGEVEFRLMKSFADDPPDDVAAETDRLTKQVGARWAVSPLAVPPIPNGDEAAIRRGYELFVGPKAGCLNCHQDFGRTERWLYDAWGTASKVTDLTQGEFRGGSSPEDLYRRVRLGIPAAGMPGTLALTDAEVWDLVHFVRAAGKAAQLPADVRAKIYSKHP